MCRLNEETRKYYTIEKVCISSVFLWLLFCLNVSELLGSCSQNVCGSRHISNGIVSNFTTNICENPNKCVRCLIVIDRDDMIPCTMGIDNGGEYLDIKDIKIRYQLGAKIKVAAGDNPEVCILVTNFGWIFLILTLISGLVGIISIIMCIILSIPYIHKRIEPDHVELVKSANS